MPTWSEILKELHETTQQPGVKSSFDFVRRKYLKAVFDLTKRNTILYASCWTSKPDVPPSFLSISDEDLQGLMEVIHGLSGSKLDLILHTPGGPLEVAEAFVSYLRSKFSTLFFTAGRIVICF